MVPDGRASNLNTGSRNLLAGVACIADTGCVRNTIRNSPGDVDAALRRAAREQGKSLNEVVIEAPAHGADLGRRRDLRGIAGSWQEDAAFDNAIAAQDAVDEKMWQ